MSLQRVSWLFRGFPRAIKVTCSILVDFKANVINLYSSLIFFPTLFHRLQKRQADLQDLDLSTAAILTNDSHFHAIVHWTGYPHENIFILTRQPSESTGLSIETWLWRLEIHLFSLYREGVCIEKVNV